MFERFKAAWKVKRGSDYERRKGKVEAALHEVMKAAAPLEAVGKNGNEGAQLAFNSAVSSHKALHDRMKQADKLVATKPGDAYALLEDIKKQAKLAAKAAQTAREEKVFRDPSSRLQLDMGDDWEGDPPKVHPASIKGFENLSKEEIEQATQEIGNKVKNGKRLLDDLLLNPDAYLEREPELKEITDLMWYLRNKAEELVGQPFEKGALSLPDNGKLLRGYLDRCSEVYNRFSSHMKEQQKKVGGSARAVDFYEGDIKNNPDGLLPYGMNTMLVQSITMDETGEERLYVKLETESARLGAPSGGAFIGAKRRHNLEVDPQLQESRGDLDFATLPKSRDRNEEDWPRTKAHFKNLVIKQKSRIKGLKRFTENEIDGNKKNVAKELLPRYEAIVKAAKKAGLATAPLENGNYKKEFHVMVSNVEAFTGTLEGAELEDDHVALLTTAMDAFSDFAIEKGMDANAESRVMTEAVLTSDFLKPQGLTAQKVEAELGDQLAQLKRRSPDEFSASKLQALVNGARRSLQKAGNFLNQKGVKSAADTLGKEVQLVVNQIELLKHLAPSAAIEQLKTELDRLESIGDRAVVIDSRDFPTSSEAQHAYNEAVQAVYNIGQMDHLRDNDRVQKALAKLAEAADEFLEVIEIIEGQEEDREDVGGDPTPPTPTTKPSTSKPSAKPTVVGPPPAPIAYGSLSKANPTLYFEVNSQNSHNFRVDSTAPGGGWNMVEQFCAYLATEWLLKGGNGNLKFEALGDKDAAVETVKDWAGNGGAAGQVGYARGKIGGSSVVKATVLDKVNKGQYKNGSQIWFGNDRHAMAAVVVSKTKVRVYDPNTGQATESTAADFATHPPGDPNVFVVKES